MFQILDTIVALDIRFNFRCAILFTVIWIIKVPIPGKPIFSNQNDLRWANFIMFDWMIVDSADSVHMQYIYVLHGVPVQTALVAKEIMVTI
jgi:hypothetical protein